MMGVVRLPERRMYWRTKPDGLFPALDFGKIMDLRRFEDFLNVWQLSDSDEMDQQVIDFIEAVNANLKRAMRAWDVLCVDESMIEAYDRGLNGKIKIIRKPHPTGNELKTVSDAATHIVLHMELHELKEDMAEKEYVKEYGATTACSLRLINYWKGMFIMSATKLNQINNLRSRKIQLGLPNFLRIGFEPASQITLGVSVIDNDWNKWLMMTKIPSFVYFLIIDEAHKDKIYS